MLVRTLVSYCSCPFIVESSMSTFLVNRIVTRKQHPEALRPLLPEISEFARFNHDIVHVMLRYVICFAELRCSLRIPCPLVGFSLSVSRFLRKRLYATMDSKQKERLMVGTFVTNPSSNCVLTIINPSSLHEIVSHPPSGCS